MSDIICGLIIAVFAFGAYHNEQARMVKEQAIEEEEWTDIETIERR